MTPFNRSSLVAALVACLALAAPAQAQFNPFNRQPAPPAEIPGDPNEAAQLVDQLKLMITSLLENYIPDPKRRRAAD